MKKIICAALLSSVLLLTSCATLFTRASYPFTINSEPNGAKLIIINSQEQIVFTGTTPAQTRLRSSKGYMKNESYQLIFQKEGFEEKIITIQARLDGWYIGNIMLGGLIGMLIVDPLSGAMYRFKRNERKMTQTLVPQQTDVALNIYDINHLPQGTSKEDLERIVF